MFAGFTWNQDTVEKQLCVIHASANCRFHVQYSGSGWPDGHAATPGDG